LVQAAPSFMAAVESAARERLPLAREAHQRGVVAGADLLALRGARVAGLALGAAGGDEEGSATAARRAAKGFRIVMRAKLPCRCGAGVSATARRLRARP